MMDSVAAPPPVPPTRGQGWGVLGGLVLTGILHVAAFFVAAIAAEIVSGMRPRSEAPLGIIIVFLAGLGLWQWAYVAPAALLCRRLGLAGTAKGLWIGGGLGTLLSAICYGSMALGSLAGTLAPRITGSPSPSRMFPVKGTVESFDIPHLRVKTMEGTVVSVTVSTGTDYVALGASGGATHTTLMAVKPGVRVSIDAWKDEPEPSALIVRVVEDGRAMP